MIDKTLDKINKLVPQKWQWILSHEGFRKYFKNTGWMFLGQAFSIISVFVGIWMARYLGPENFGVFSFAIAFVGMFSVIANFGITGILSRDLIKYPEKRDKLLGTAFVLNIIGGLLAFFVTISFSLILDNSDITRILIFIWSTSFIFSAFSLPAHYFQATVNAKKNAQAQIIITIASSLLKILLIIFDKGVIWLMLIYVFDYILGGLLYAYNYKKAGLNIKNWSYDNSIAKAFLSVSWLLVLSSVASSLLMKIDQVMIGYYIGSFAVGIYAAAVRLVEIWYFIPAIICGSLFPAIINSKNNGEANYKKRLNYLYKLLFVISVIIALPLTFFAPWFIDVLYGQPYHEAIEVLRIYIWSGVGLFINFGINQYLLAENKLKRLFYLNLFAMIVNIILNLLFIPYFGILGAAWATFISYCLSPILFFVIDHKSKL
jgi:O-antigen/teichoic acid export membrane protein